MDKIFGLLLRWFDDSIPAGTLRAFLAAGLERCQQAEARLSAQAWVELARAVALFQAGTRSQEAISTPARGSGAGLLPLTGKIVTGRGVAPGTGDSLLWHFENGALLDAELETLLRHVEVKRRQCLQLDPPGAVEDFWLERHAVAILFCRAARAHGDWRLLNAALKLNDWAFPAQRRLPAGDRLARYLLALAEQETALEALAHG